MSGWRNSALSSKLILASRQIELVVLGDDQRIDLEHAHVLLGEGLVEPREQAAHLLLQIAGEMQRLRDAAHVVRTDAGHRIDADGDDLVRRVVRDLFDVHAAFGRDHERHARGGAIDQRREIELAIDGGAFFDVEAVDLLALRAGLLGHQHRAEDARGLGAHVVDRLHDLDAAGLAAAAGMDLRLHHDHRRAEVLGRLDGFVDGEGGVAARHDHPEFPEHRLGLVFVDIHGASSPTATLRIMSVPIGYTLFQEHPETQSTATPTPISPDFTSGIKRLTVAYRLPRLGAMVMQASTRVFTAAADLSNIERSALLSWISTIRSTPFAPMTHGTPT